MLSKFSADVVKLTEEVYGSETPVVLEALMKPVGTYYVRCNTFKLSVEELLDRLQQREFKVFQHSLVPEALGIQVEGPFEIPPADRRVVVDKHTAESVLQGANVYAPGVLNCKGLRVGEDVAVVSELGDELGTGRAKMNTN